MLGSAVPTFERLLEDWKELASGAPHCAPLINIGLTWAEKYDDRMACTNAYAVAMFVDPTCRMSWAEDHWDKVRVDSARVFILNLMHAKRAQKLPDVPVPTHPVSRLQARTLGSRIYGLSERDVPLHSHDIIQTVEQEFGAYTTANLSLKGTNVLSFWQMSEAMFPTVYAIAMDYLPIQASAVPCERVFSSSSETYTKKRNRISPVLMEALQMVKFSVKKEQLNFTKGWAASQWDMEGAMVSDNGSDELLAPVSSETTGDGRAYDAVLKAIAEHECDDVDDEVTIYDT